MASLMTFSICCSAVEWPNLRIRRPKKYDKASLATHMSRASIYAAGVTAAVVAVIRPAAVWFVMELCRLETKVEIVVEVRDELAAFRAASAASIPAAIMADVALPLAKPEIMGAAVLSVTDRRTSGTSVASSFSAAVPASSIS